jgi:hypothetical protein
MNVDPSQLLEKSPHLASRLPDRGALFTIVRVSYFGRDVDKDRQRVFRNFHHLHRAPHVGGGQARSDTAGCSPRSASGSLSTLPSVKLRSRVLTALNLLPSMATSACGNSFSSRRSITKRRHTLRMPMPLSRRESAMVFKSGASRPVSHINPTLRWHSRPSQAFSKHGITWRARQSVEYT